MAYRNFKLIDLQRDFDLIIERRKMPDKSQAKFIMPSDWLIETVRRSRYMVINNYKNLWAHLLLPILSEVKINNRKHVSFYYNETMNADMSKKLNGKIDFIFVQTSIGVRLHIPLLYITTAKKNETLDELIPQIAAQMIGAHLQNKMHKQELRTVYGAVILSESWVFLRLKGNVLLIDTDIYHLDNLPAILGVFQCLLKPQPLY